MNLLPLSSLSLSLLTLLQMFWMCFLSEEAAQTAKCQRNAPRSSPADAGAAAVLANSWWARCQNEWRPTFHRQRGVAQRLAAMVASVHIARISIIQPASDGAVKSGESSVFFNKVIRKRSAINLNGPISVLICCVWTSQGSCVSLCGFCTTMWQTFTEGISGSVWLRVDQPALWHGSTTTREQKYGRTREEKIVVQGMHLPVFSLHTRNLQAVLKCWLFSDNYSECWLSTHRAFMNLETVWEC